MGWGFLGLWAFVSFSALSSMSDIHLCQWREMVLLKPIHRPSSTPYFETIIKSKAASPWKGNRGSSIDFSSVSQKSRNAEGGHLSLSEGSHTPLNVVFCPLQNGALAWSDDADGGRGREISRDFAKVCNVFVIKIEAVLQWAVSFPIHTVVSGRWVTSVVTQMSVVALGWHLQWDGMFHCGFFLGSDLQLYELDSDPERKEFLDDLFVFMQKRGKCVASHSSN